MARFQARAYTHRAQHVRYVRIFGPTVEAVVLEEDWRLILPKIEDGTISPIRTPTSASFGFLHPEVTLDQPILDQGDPRLYDRILHTLQELFPEEYPTSDL